MTNVEKSTNRGRKKMMPSKTELDKLVFYCRVPRTLTEILNYMGYTNRTKFRNKYVKPLLQDGKLLMTNKTHPTSKFQKYVAKEIAK